MEDPDSEIPVFCGELSIGRDLSQFVNPTTIHGCPK
jgi:hypothetical protein